MNRVELIGRLVRDPEIRVNNDKSIARFSLAVQRKYKNSDGRYEADFINCVAFGKTCEFIEKYFGKGSQIAIGGHIQTGSYTNKDGQKVYTTDVIADEAEFVGSKGDNGSGQAEAKPKSNKQAAADDGFLNIPDTVDDLPFVQ